MVKAKRKSSATDDLSAALAEHASDQTDYGQDYTDLPGGIKGGVAALASAKVGEYASGPNQGKPFLYLSGTVINPKEAVETVKVFEDGEVKVVSSRTVPIQGLFTKWGPQPLCSTTKGNGEIVTIGENVAKALNELRKLGADTSGVKSLDDLTPICEALVEAAPFFKFTTTASNPTAQYESRVWHNWFGSEGVEDYVDDSVDEETADVVEEDDSEGIVEEENEAPEKGSPEPEEGDTGEEYDFETLGDLAEADDEESQNVLIELADKAGIDHSELSWTDLGKALAESDGGDSEDGVSVGDSVSYKPPRSQKTLKCKVTAVFETKRTCNLEGPGKKVYKSVSWDKLS